MADEEQPAAKTPTPPGSEEPLRLPIKMPSKHYSGGEFKEEVVDGLMELLMKPTELDGMAPCHPDFVQFRRRNLQWRLGHHEGTNTQEEGKWGVAGTPSNTGGMTRCASWPTMERFPSQRKLWLLSPELDRDLKRGFPQLWHKLQSHLGVLVQVIILVLVVFTYAACPLTVSWSKVVGSDGEGRGAVPIKGRPFKESTVIVASWALIATVGLSLAMAMGGRKAVHQCFDKEAIVRFSPAGLGWALADVCEVLAVARIDPATYGVLSQARLLGAASAAYLLRGTRQSQLQWGVLASLSLVCMGYCLVPDDPINNKTRLLDWRLHHMEFRINRYTGHVPVHHHHPHDHGPDEDVEGHEFLAGVLLALGKVGLSVFSGVYAEACFKLSNGRAPPPLHVQMTQISFSSTAAALTGHFFLSWLQHENPLDMYSGPDGHWTYRTVVVAVMYCWREWICNICVKRFDALVKNICNAIALVVTYLFTVVITGEKPFCLLKVTLLFAAVVEVVNYVATRRGEPPVPKPKKGAEPEQGPKGAELTIEAKEL